MSFPWLARVINPRLGSIPVLFFTARRLEEVLSTAFWISEVVSFALPEILLGCQSGLSLVPSLPVGSGPALARAFEWVRFSFPLGPP